MKGKSILSSIITFVIGAIGVLSTLLSVAIQQWLGAVGFLLTAFLSTFMSTGDLPKGWTVTLWVSAIAGTIVQLLGYFVDHSLMNAAQVNIIVALINLFITTFLKDYGNGSVIKKAA